MLTTVISDLHAGAAASVLNTPAVRERLAEALAEADQVVLLGDVLSLRDAPLQDVLELAAPALEPLAEPLRGRRVVVVPGNHDHRLVAPLLETRPLAAEGAELAVEWPLADEAGEPLASLARWLPHSDLVVSYPGFWITENVYATHGHYLDCHLSVPRPESVAAQALAALSGRLQDGHVAAADYEAVVAPIYAFAYSRAQAPDREREHSRAPLARLARGLREHGWNRILGDGGDWRGMPKRVFVGGIALAALAAANRLGVGRFSTDLSPAEIGRAGFRAMEEVVTRLQIPAAFVVFGHLHRAGPLEGEPAWALADGTSLLNAGSWVYEPSLIREPSPRDPFWPGTTVVVGDNGPPSVRSLLDDEPPRQSA